jgi:hypothetical protein
MLELCQKFNIGAYPSIFAMAASDGNNDMKNIGNRLFSVSKIEKALKLTGAALPERDLGLGDGAKATDGESTDESETAPKDNEEESEEVVKGADSKVDLENQTEEDEGDIAGDEDEDETEPGVGNVGNEQGNQAGSDDKKSNFWKGKEAVIPVHSKAGAEVAKNGAHAMDKWKEIQKQRIREKEYKWLRQRKAKSGNIGKELISNSGATAIMLANRRGTDEFNARQKDLLKVLLRMQKSRNRKREEMLKRMKQGQLMFKKEVTRPSFVEAVPLIKRTVKMTTEEQLILDASLSFREGLRVGVYKSMKPLVPKEKHVLKNWLDLLRISLPPEWGLHETIDDLAENIHKIAQSPHDFIAILAKRPFPRTKWSESCGKENGFNCGFWKLLHIMTIGVAEQRGGRDLIDAGIIAKSTRVFSPMEAADTVREYMAMFFPCTDCSQHFIAQYDQCETNRRCDRLTNDLSTATDADWKELARWLWEFHNDVSVRLLNQKLDDERKSQQQVVVLKASAVPKGATMAEQVQVLWPTPDGCGVCFNEDGSFNEEVVFLHLERTYW